MHFNIKLKSKMKLIVALLLVTAFASARLINEQNVIINPIPGGLSGVGTTTRYWDCCKPTCAWPGNVEYKTPVKACQADGVTANDPENESGCVGGQSYICTAQSGFAINSSLAYGFVAARFHGTTRNMCCSCVLFTFQPAELAGKQMLVQVTNTGNAPETETNLFDIAMPGSGVGYYTEGCTTQWNSDVHNWGDQYGGVNSEAECYNLPQPLWEGCAFRFKWMLGYSNPDVSFQEVECPNELLSISGCSPISHP
ncbi:endoglucanase-like [Diorhabda sublineata]|uniref:endoglucanase-like n=1 Tax=Diorhabda sublineata TaxID=1163346 RepID=UPI0024E0833B|nr:endoglucanase-like [Diorhabda sublineata]